LVDRSAALRRVGAWSGKTRETVKSVAIGNSFHSKRWVTLSTTNARTETTTHQIHHGMPYEPYGSALDRFQEKMNAKMIGPR